MEPSTLAILGGPKTRGKKLPDRMSFGDEELTQVKRVFDHYQSLGSDIGYQGKFEEDYCKAFVRFLGEDGYCDAVNSGTNALFVSIRALGLKRGDHVLVSPVTDPGTLSAIIMNDLVPVIMDSAPHSFNVNLDSVKRRLTDKTKLIIVVHLGGKAAPVADIAEFAKSRGLFLLEDCSQSHGAKYQGRSVGVFGDIGVFSTMFTKSHSSGSNGGLIYTKSKSLYEVVRSHADRGKNFFSPTFDGKDPDTSLFPGLNFNQDEISSAIGMASLSKLPSVNQRRVQFLQKVQAKLKAHSKTCRLLEVTEEDAPFFWPVEIDATKIKCSKIEFAEALRAEGIGINPHYKFIVTKWGWMQNYLTDKFSPENAIAYQASTFNILFNERYTDLEVEDTVRAILKVENYYLR